MKTKIVTVYCKKNGDRNLKRRRVKTSLGKEFSPNSLSHLLSNKRYIGVYLYKGKETPGGMPRILDDDLFYRVQSMMNKSKNAPARTHGEGEYLLTTKLFCGHCKEMMVGYGGTSKTGRQYHYYMCKNARRKKCGKKIDNVPLDDIESVFEGSGGASEGCSSLSTPAPPRQNNTMRSSAAASGVRSTDGVVFPFQIEPAAPGLISGIFFAYKSWERADRL